MLPWDQHGPATKMLSALCLQPSSGMIEAVRQTESRQTELLLAKTGGEKGQMLQG